MTSDNSSTKASNRRVNNRTPLFLIIIGILLGIISGLLYFVWNMGENPTTASPTVDNSSTQLETETSISIKENPSNGAVEIVDSSKPAPPPQSITSNLSEQKFDQAEQQLPPLEEENVFIEDESTVTALPLQPEKNSSTEPLSPCANSAMIVKDFFLHLDSQTYIQEFLKGQKSEVYFIKLIQKLVDNPPVVTKETDDLFTILKNTAHFYRILGKDNILILKAILSNERNQVENVLAHFYNVSLFDQCSEEQLQLRLPKSALYDYGGFFLHTMGGRLYLFRRDSASRLAVSYYSILLIELANREGRNSHGININPAVELLIPEIENSGELLMMRDTYLLRLYELEARIN